MLRTITASTARSLRPVQRVVVVANRSYSEAFKKKEKAAEEVFFRKKEQEEIQKLKEDLARKEKEAESAKKEKK